MRHCARARDTGTRISRSRPGSSIRAIAAPILAFYEFVRTADDIADHADACAGREARAARPARSAACRREQRGCGGGAAARGAGRARPVAAARPGPACRFPARCDQAALSRLGRPHRLLFAFGHAGRPLRARRARREPRRLAGQRCAVRRAADHQSPAGLPGRTTAISTGSMCRSMRSPPAGHRRRGAGRAAGARRRCSPACTASPNAPDGCCPRATCFPP